MAQPLLKTLFFLLLIALLAVVFVYRWNHEAVRVYDMPPIRLGR